MTPRLQTPDLSFMDFEVRSDPATWERGIAVIGIGHSEPYAHDPCPNDQTQGPAAIRAQSGQFGWIRAAESLKVLELPRRYSHRGIRRGARLPTMIVDLPSVCRRYRGIAQMEGLDTLGRRRRLPKAITCHC